MFFRRNQAGGGDSAPWLVVGLGNPGEKYAHTRHNVGEDVVRQWSGQAAVSLKRLKSFGEVATVPGAGVVLALPAGYMNTSGGPVSGLTRYYKTPPERVVVIHDDLDLPVGTIRLKRGGGHGGHNGLRDIHKALGTPEFIRVRVGIGRPPGRMDAADYVLRPIPSSERTEWEMVRAEAIDAAVMVIEQGLEAAQQKYHSAP